MNNNKFFFVACTDNYPLSSSANNTKIGLLSQGLQESGDDVVIINKYYGGLREKKYGIYKKCYYVTFPTTRRKTLSSFVNLWRICSLLKKKKSKKNKNIIVLSCGSFLHNFILVAYTKLIGFKSVLIFQEWHLSFDIDFLHNFNNILFDKYLGAFVHGILPISEFIMIKCKKLRKPLLKLPIIADFSEKNASLLISTYFLYCASAGYFRIIKFILDSFLLLKNKYANVELVFILSGSSQEIGKVNDEICKLGLQESIHIYSKLPYTKLLEYYSHALGLLIPLDPTSLQDQARFSQKIAEYLSSCRPILTNNVGEIAYYFTNEENAFIANEFTEEAYAHLMGKVVKYPKLARRVGENGYFLGKEFFSYKKNAEAVHNFCLKL